jgi:hypothetical protein
MRFTSASSLALAAAIMVAACGKTGVIETHPQIAQASEGTAKVYFLRPNVGYQLAERGAFTVELEGETLLTISPGEYKLVYLRPGSGALAVEGTTVMSRNGKPLRTSVRQQSAIPLVAGRTYYVGFQKHARAITDGGGTSFSAVVIPDERVAEIARTVKPVGLAAREPIAAAVAP